VVAEVNNTFGERHAYLLDGPEGLAVGRRRSESRKVFHVSPFCAGAGLLSLPLRAAAVRRPRWWHVSNTTTNTPARP
jgi:DUF1365 family protein